MRTYCLIGAGFPLCPPRTLCSQDSVLGRSSVLLTARIFASRDDSREPRPLRRRYPGAYTPPCSPPPLCPPRTLCSQDSVPGRSSVLLPARIFASREDSREPRPLRRRYSGAYTPPCSPPPLCPPVLTLFSSVSPSLCGEYSFGCGYAALGLRGREKKSGEPFSPDHVSRTCVVESWAESIFSRVPCHCGESCLLTT